MKVLRAIFITFGLFVLLCWASLLWAYTECGRFDNWVYSECLDTFPQQCRYYCLSDPKLDSFPLIWHEDSDDPEILHLNADNRVIIADIDLLELLERCREFIYDYPEYAYKVKDGSFLWTNPTEFEYLNQHDNAEIVEIKYRLDKRKRERKVRKNIETIIKHLGELQ